VIFIFSNFFFAVRYLAISFYKKLGILRPNILFYIFKSLNNNNNNNNNTAFHILGRRFFFLFCFGLCLLVLSFALYFWCMGSILNFYIQGFSLYGKVRPCILEMSVTTLWALPMAQHKTNVCSCDRFLKKKTLIFFYKNSRCTWRYVFRV
jgi:hypothetical protein